MKKSTTEPRMCFRCCKDIADDDFLAAARYTAVRASHTSLPMDARYYLCPVCGPDAPTEWALCGAIHRVIEEHVTADIEDDVETVVSLLVRAQAAGVLSPFAVAALPYYLMIAGAACALRDGPQDIAHDPDDLRDEIARWVALVWRAWDATRTSSERSPDLA